MNPREYNVGHSDYSKRRIQPWDIWFEYGLNLGTQTSLSASCETKANVASTTKKSNTSAMNASDR